MSPNLKLALRAIVAVVACYCVVAATGFGVFTLGWIGFLVLAVLAFVVAFVL